MGRSGDVYGHPNARRLLATVNESLSVAETWTPLDALMEKDPAESADQGEVMARLKMTVMVRHFLLLAEFLTAGVAQADELELRCVIALRAAAPRVLWSRYGVSISAARRMEDKLRAVVARRPRWNRAAAGVSLRWLLSGLFDEDELELAALRATPVEMLRQEGIEAICGKLAERARVLSDFPKVAAAVLRRVTPDFLTELGESQAAISRKYDEQRATVSAREMRVVEEPMIAAGANGYHLLGGTKSDAHREACARAQRGNTNRTDGEARKRGELDEPDGPTADEEASAVLDPWKERVKRLAAEAERRRLVALFGPGVAGCDPEKTVPLREQ